MWWQVGTTVSALASLAPRVVRSGRYRLGARFARASCDGKWALPFRRSLRSPPRRSKFTGEARGVRGGNFPPEVGRSTSAGPAERYSKFGRSSETGGGCGGEPSPPPVRSTGGTVFEVRTHGIRSSNGSARAEHQSITTPPHLPLRRPTFFKRTSVA